MVLNIILITLLVKDFWNKFLTSSSEESVYITAEYTYNGQKWAYITYSVPGQKNKSEYIRIE